MTCAKTVSQDRFDAQRPQRKGWDGRRAAPYAGPDPFELSRQRAVEMFAPEGEDAEATERRAEEATEPAGQSDEP